MELFKELYHICFYLVVLFKHYLFVTSLAVCRVYLTLNKIIN